VKVFYFPQPPQLRRSAARFPDRHTTKKIPDAFFWLWNNPETPLKARRPAAVNIMRLRKVFVKHILVLLHLPSLERHLCSFLLKPGGENGKLWGFDWVSVYFS
jgi:hypothetical protein